MTRFSTIFKQKCSYLRPLLSITFPQGFRICKNIGHPTSGSGGKKTFKRYLKSEHTDTQTDRQTHRRTNRLIESIGPEGRCFENPLYVNCGLVVGLGSPTGHMPKLVCLVRPAPKFLIKKSSICNLWPCG